MRHRPARQTFDAESSSNQHRLHLQNRSRSKSCEQLRPLSCLQEPAIVELFLQRNCYRLNERGSMRSISTREVRDKARRWDRNSPLWMVRAGLLVIFRGGKHIGTYPACPLLLCCHLRRWARRLHRVLVSSLHRDKWMQWFAVSHDSSASRDIDRCQHGSQHCDRSQHYDDVCRCGT
jgi:hypothetical protein